MKKSTTKYLIVARGPGETGQARALAKFISKKGEEVLLAIHQEKNLSFLINDKELKIFVVENPLSLKELIEKEKPNVLLLFNSKMWGGDFSKEPPFEKPPLCLAVDSNWLFNDREYFPAFQAVSWVEKYLVLFPKKIFELGLKENGGGFPIEKEELKKIIPVGFIPSYKKPGKKTISKFRKKYGIQKDERFIFSYFSGFGAGHRVFAFNNLITAVDRLVKKGRRIKVLYLGPRENLDPEKLKRPWLIKEASLPSQEYFLTLASSDLVFQHQGMVSLAQAISSQVPVIANVSLLESEALPKIHFWEVRPFERAGVCRMLSASDPLEKISQTVEELLFDKKVRRKMKKLQKKILENGERKSYKIIKDLLCAN